MIRFKIIEAKNNLKSFLIFLFAAILLSSCSKQKILADFYIQDVNIIDVKDGKLIDKQSVALKDNKISAIYSKKMKLHKDTKVIDGTGKYLMPGLWDMHTHYGWNYSFSNPYLIANGVLGIREMWGEMDTIHAIRNMTERGEMLAPQIYSAGNIIDGPPGIWPGSAVVGDAEKAKKEAEEQIAAGVDFLKVYSLLTKEAYYAIAQVANEKGINFAGHVPDWVGIWKAIEAGQQSIEHLTGFLEGCSDDPNGVYNFSPEEWFSKKRIDFIVDHFDENLSDSLCEKLAKSDTWMCPTLTVLRSTSNMDDTNYRKDERLDYMPAYIRQMWNPQLDFRFAGRDSSFYDASRRRFDVELALIETMDKAGVKILAGTDYPNPYCYPGFSLHDELQNLVEGGMSNAGALRAATYNPAIFMEKENKFGQVKTGLDANLVLLSQNPLEEISNSKKIIGVFYLGQYLDRSALDQLLEEGKKIAAKTNTPSEF